MRLKIPNSPKDDKIIIIFIQALCEYVLQFFDMYQKGIF